MIVDVSVPLVDVRENEVPATIADTCTIPGVPPATALLKKINELAVTAVVDTVIVPDERIA